MRRAMPGSMTYLRAKYGSDEALRAAWGDELGKDEKLGSIKMGWINERLARACGRVTYIGS